MTPEPVVASTPRTARTSSPSEVLHLPDRPPVLTLGPEFFRRRMRARLRDMKGRQKSGVGRPAGQYGPPAGYPRVSSEPRLRTARRSTGEEAVPQAAVGARRRGATR